MTTSGTTIRSEHAPDVEETVALYASTGWTAYSRDPATLMAAVAGSHLVLTVRVDQRLVGLARTISDGSTICYLQDLLVHPSHRRRGLGRALMTELRHRYRHCRQFVLSTEADDPAAHAFYRAVGLVPADELPAVTFHLPVPAR